ncbi:MFS transporter [Kribbella solani]|uniref:MFS transporter n=1 Tax=Kribbella solani TaxID=236067 RepID=UPI0029A01F01|nr:MFS transporter [Kribbella solani]MDX2973690.1 MFS transporter [Kribbella solani]
MQAAEGARPGSARSLRRALWGLCVTELISWGVLYYTVPATLPTLVARTGWTVTAIMTGFSCGLLASAAAAIPVGRLIDRYGPRWVMTGGSLLGTTSLALAALASSPLAFGLAWLPAGVAMAALLYPPAFTALTYWYGPRRSRALMTLTLVGGLASTVFAPLSGLLAAELGWRVTYVVLAAFLLATTGPIHLICLKLPCVAQTGRVRHDRHTRQVRTSRTFWLLTTALALAARRHHPCRRRRQPGRARADPGACRAVGGGRASHRRGLLSRTRSVGTQACTGRWPSSPPPEQR